MPNLSQKLGPLPVWAWGGLAAVAVWFLFLRGKTSTSAPSGTSTATGTSPTGQATTDYSLGYAQGVQASGTGAQTSAAPSSAPASVTLTGGQTGVFATPAFDTGQLITWLPAGTQLPSAGSPVAGGNFGSGTQQSHFWQPVTYGGQRAYVWAPFASPGVAPGGVGGPSRKHAIGSRSAWLWTDAHPLIGAPVPYSHYVRAVGGPGNHLNEVRRVAAQSNVHPARVLALNARPASLIRIA